MNRLNCIYVRVFLTVFLFGIAASAVYCELPAGFVRVTAGTVQLAGVQRSLAVKENSSARVELEDRIMTSPGAKATFYGFDGSSFIPEAQSTYEVREKGVFQEVGEDSVIIHGFLLPLTHANLNGKLPRGRQPGVSWFSTSPMRAPEKTSVGPAVETTSGKLQNGDVIASPEGSVVKLDGGERGTALLGPASSVRILPFGYSLENGGGMFHLGPDKRMELHTSRFYISAVDSFFELSIKASVPVLKVLRGKASLYLASEKATDYTRKAVRGGQSYDFAQGAVVTSGDRSALYKVAMDFTSRLNETGLRGFSEQFLNGLRQAPQRMSNVEAYEGPALPSSGLSGSSNATQPQVQNSSLPQVPVSSPIPRQVSQTDLPSPQSGATSTVTVPEAIEKKADRELNPLNKKLPGESPADWY